MSKLAVADKFLDFSDYGRPLAKLFAIQLKNTSFTPIHVTLLFGVVGLLGVYCMLQGYYVLAAVCLILKSIIDAADGELSRLQNCPSYSGRYLDSIFDIVLNFIFLATICYISDSPFYQMLMAFVALQLQGTLYNYYYVILRNQRPGADKTSQIFEYQTPQAFPQETQRSVNILFAIFYVLYAFFDKAIYRFDKQAIHAPTFPNWFMSLVSIYGLGFQLLLMALFLALHLGDFIIPFFIMYSVFIVVFICIRKLFLK